MIILRNVSFAQQAQFLRDNVCDYPSDPAFDNAVRNQDDTSAEGLRAHLELLKTIYTDVSAVEGKDDKARYANLIATVDFLYAAFAHGTLHSNSDGATARIDKGKLTQAYKRGSVARRRRHLEHHGFSVRYLAGDRVSRSLSQASHVVIAYGPDPNLVPALKRFAEHVLAMPDGEEPPACNQLATFLKADYTAAFLARPVPRDGLDPLRSDILRTVGRYRGEWIALVETLSDRNGLSASGFWHYGASPAWSLSFSEGHHKPLAIFTLGSEIVFIEFTLPVGAAKDIILARHAYSQTIRERIESFRCVKCPKSCGGENLTKVDGVWLCSGRAEARRIYATLLTPEDFASIHAMIDMSYRQKSPGTPYPTG